MIIFDILTVITGTLVCVYVFADLIYSIRNVRYQKLWNKEKAMREKIDPAITRAELCEQYVMFCKRNGCKVKF
jgi:hypothetical protein